MSRFVPIFIYCAVSLLLPNASAQTEVDNTVDEILNETLYSQERIRVPLLLLGTFHFQDASLDSFKPQHQIDVKSPKRQQEIEKIVEQLAAFNPTKIAVERTHESREFIQQQYEEYLSGAQELEPNEIYQIGFRLAKKLGHTQVNPVDAKGRSFEPVIDRRAYAKDKKLTRMLREPYSTAQFQLSQKMDALKMQHSLSEHLLIMNHPKMLQAQHGIYLQKSLSLGEDGDYPSADGFVSQWYNRNLRIFANVHRTAEKGDRILLIIGGGHVPLLRHFGESAAEFEIVEVSDVLTTDP